ncbi:endoribonuclease rege-1-like [Rhopalosiphum maidis]|uniref:endoribonuclease rege-1-like n=1 Tax=Rhopalosiphum maidis TaxID=43146 RepID=UPI000EFE1155|nr:endoribonuclease rege-1-like [Rhopalosiphum maidis]
MDRLRLQTRSIPAYSILGLINSATYSNITALNDTNNGAIDLTLGAIAGNHIMAHNNYGRIQNDAKIFHQINYISPSPIDCITISDDDNDINTVHQQSAQSAQFAPFAHSSGQSFQFAGQSASQFVQSIQSAGQSPSQSVQSVQSIQSAGQSPSQSVQSVQSIQSAGQSVQSAGQSLQYIQHNYMRQEPNYFQRLASPSTSSIVLGEQRPIIIDGLNIGYAHGCNKKFSAKGIVLCVQYFTNLGFRAVRILLPQHYQGMPGSETHSNISLLLNAGYVFFTPSRKIKNVRLTCYSDRIILDHAYNCGGVVVSNDNFRDLYEENEKFKEVIENRHIMIMFINDEIIVPSDQYSRQYPNLYLSNILHFPS